MTALTKFIWSLISLAALIGVTAFLAGAVGRAAVELFLAGWGVVG